MSLCNRTIHMSPSLSINFEPNSSYHLTCCNTTLDKSHFTNSSEYIMVNVIKMSQRISSFRIFDNRMRPIKLMNYTQLNGTYFKTDIINLPLTFSLCQFSIQSFKIIITNISRGKKNR